MGDPDFEAFFSAHYEPVARALTLATGERDRAEEATQEAFARALRKWRTVREMERPVGWVYVVGMNHMRTGFRRRNRERQHSEAVVDADTTGSVTTRLAVRDAIATLPPRQREAIVLRYLADLPLASVAEAMGCAVGTAKATVHRALQALRIEMEDDDAN